MPRFDIERHGRAVQLCVSTFNAMMLAGGMIWAAAVFYGDSKTGGAHQAKQIDNLTERVAKLEGADQGIIGIVRDGQEKTNGRLTTLETQNVFIMRALDRVETAVAKPR